MWIRRTILAPAILAAGTVGVLAAGPVLTVTVTVAASPAAAAVAGVAGGFKPTAVVYHT